MTRRASLARAVRSPAGRRAAVVVALGLLPWTVLAFDSGVDLVFLFGLVTPRPFHVVTVTDYLFRFSGGPAGLPRRLLACPVSSLLYAGALASALLEARGRGDGRVTAGSLALAGVDHLWFALGVGSPSLLAVPVGPALAFVCAWWLWPRRAPAN